MLSSMNCVRTYWMYVVIKKVKKIKKYSETCIRSLMMVKNLFVSLTISTKFCEFFK